MLTCEVDMPSVLHFQGDVVLEVTVDGAGRSSRKLNVREGKKNRVFALLKGSTLFSHLSNLSPLSLFILKMKKTMNSLSKIRQTCERMRKPLHVIAIL